MQSTGEKALLYGIVLPKVPDSYHTFSDKFEEFVPNELGNGESFSNLPLLIEHEEELGEAGWIFRGFKVRDKGEIYYTVLGVIDLESAAGRDAYDHIKRVGEEGAYRDLSLSHNSELLYNPMKGEMKIQKRLNEVSVCEEGARSSDHRNCRILFCEKIGRANFGSPSGDDWKLPVVYYEKIRASKNRIKSNIRLYEPLYNFISRSRSMTTTEPIQESEPQPQMDEVQQQPRPSEAELVPVEEHVPDESRKRDEPVVDEVAPPQLPDDLENRLSNLNPPEQSMYMQEMAKRFQTMSEERRGLEERLKDAENALEKYRINKQREEQEIARQKIEQSIETLANQMGVTFKSDEERLEFINKHAGKFDARSGQAFEELSAELFQASAKRNAVDPNKKPRYNGDLKHLVSEDVRRFSQLASPMQTYMSYPPQRFHSTHERVVDQTIRKSAATVPYRPRMEKFQTFPEKSVQPVVEEPKEDQDSKSVVVKFANIQMSRSTREAIYDQMKERMKSNHHNMEYGIGFDILSSAVSAHPEWYLRRYPDHVRRGNVGIRVDDNNHLVECQMHVDPSLDMLSDQIAEDLDQKIQEGNNKIATFNGWL